MVNYPSTNILISPLGIKNLQNINEIKTYLEVNGHSYYQNCDNPNRKEYNYFLGNSVILMKEYKDRVDVRIVASGETSLSLMKKNIETILDGK